MKGKLKKRIIAAFVILLLILMIVPVRGRLSDGGSVYYNAVLYEVRFVHKREIGPYGEPERLTEGTICLTLCSPGQAPLSMGFSRQEYCGRLLLPSPGDLPDLGIEARSPALQADRFFTI